MDFVGDVGENCNGDVFLNEMEDLEFFDGEFDVVGFVDEVENCVGDCENYFFCWYWRSRGCCCLIWEDVVDEIIYVEWGVEIVGRRGRGGGDWGRSSGGWSVDGWVKFGSWRGFYFFLLEVRNRGGREMKKKWRKVWLFYMNVEMIWEKNEKVRDIKWVYFWLIVK